MLKNKFQDITVTITPEMFADSDYYNIYDCALAKALKAEGYAFQSVTNYSVRDVDKQSWPMSYEDSIEVCERTGRKDQKALTVTLESPYKSVVERRV